MTLCAVIFADKHHGWWARHCRPGFRHVEVAVQSEHGWAGIAGTIGGIQVVALPAGYDPFDHAESMRASVLAVAAPQSPATARWPWAIWSCVGVAKAVLGVRSWRVQTPWGLFKHLTRRGVTFGGVATYGESKEAAGERGGDGGSGRAAGCGGGERGLAGRH